MSDIKMHRPASSGPVAPAPAARPRTAKATAPASKSATSGALAAHPQGAQAVTKALYPK